MKWIISLLMCLFLMTSVFATVTPITPSGDDTTSAATYDFAATTDNPLLDAFRTPITYISLGIDGIQEMDCTLNGLIFDCALTMNILALEGIYPITMEDMDGPTSVGDLTIDRSVDATDFLFTASDYDVTYTPGGCVDIISGVSEEVAQYSSDDWITNSNFSSTTETLIDGTYKFRGYCKDNAGNEAYTSDVEFVLPATPPQLIGLMEMPSTIICAGGFPCSESYDGAGLPIDISLKMTFDEPTIITLVLDGGISIGPSDQHVDHVVSLYSLTEGVHQLNILASDGTNAEVYTLTLDVTNTGGTGDTTIDIREPIVVYPTDPSVEILNATILKDDVLPGDFAVVQYSLFMVQGNYTRFAFTGSVDFETPITVFCVDNYDPVTKDIIDEFAANVYQINSVDGFMDETQPAILCPYTGDEVTGLEYDVIVKYPISADTTEPSLGGIFEVGLYDAQI